MPARHMQQQATEVLHSCIDATRVTVVPVRDGEHQLIKFSLMYAKKKKLIEL